MSLVCRLGMCYTACLDIDRQRFKVMLRAADRLAPVTRGKRPPLTVEILTVLHPGLDLTAPLDAAVWAALLTVFWCTARRGEFVLKTLTSFDPNLHVQRSHYRTEVREGVTAHIFTLPWTKTRRYEGEEVFFVPQPSLAVCNPLPALANHFSINNPPDDGPLFAYKHKGDRRPLTGHAMQKRLKAVATSIGVDLPPGHSARIGSLLWHLLNGMPFYGGDGQRALAICLLIPPLPSPARSGALPTSSGSSTRLL
ncbi:hypothetical protein GSI_10683 [Ganoderma sinense ZZ0214-1]|uniref:Uncharacterized protein n=1 Tax=Ganoderma sinense ZZ0214-1 TaxID=1077348 RepID=A0A2G8S186_9APHY|nr:hypothetical protein GSI_10683 [Ganoderma sinense ZZ0214-1]